MILFSSYTILTLLIMIKTTHSEKPQRCQVRQYNFTAVKQDSMESNAVEWSAPMPVTAHATRQRLEQMNFHIQHGKCSVHLCQEKTTNSRADKL
ncbi:Peptidylprolyl isomerase domain and WD repeat-containing protein [Trichinella pseudospiralis]